MEITGYNPFNEEFCQVLEYHLSKAFADSEDDDIKYFWCDGINIPDDIGIDRLLADKQINTKAWLGKNGQDIYLMTLKLGALSLDAIQSCKLLNNCLPISDLSDWVEVDPYQRTVKIQLL